MTLRLLIDMNLSPDWVAVFDSAGIEAGHWSRIGDPRAADRVLLRWARDNDYVVFTHDLDFGALLASSGDARPSVIQLRTQNLLPDHAADLILTALQSYRAELEAGALITVDPLRARVRILPLK
jgi:predicted nuclease of predicted toxin-antitoxin system